VDGDNNTKIQVDENGIDDNIIRFDLAGIERFTMQGAKLNVLNSGRSVFIGENAGAVDNLSNNNNIAIGYQAYDAAVNSVDNVAIGYQSQTASTGGRGNSSVGLRSTHKLLRFFVLSMC
jgi:hypothetical protein